MKKVFLNNALCRSAIRRFCDLLRNIADRSIADRNIAISQFLYVWQASVNVFSAKCDSRDAPSHIGVLRHFSIGDV